MQAETDKQRLLDMLEAEYEFVHRTIDSLSPAIMLEANVEGIWSIKDILVHLTAWMQRVITWLGEIAEGQAPSRPSEGFTSEQIDQLNQEQYQRDKDHPLEDVLADFHSSYHEVYALIAVISEEDLFVSTFGGLVREPIWYLVYDTHKHFHQHIQVIRKWLAEKQKIELK